jgi:hypothetical protein
MLLAASALAREQQLHQHDRELFVLSSEQCVTVHAVLTHVLLLTNPCSSLSIALPVAFLLPP